MQHSHEVTEFVIMSGPEVHDYLVTIRAQLRVYLEASFPGYRFSLVSREGEGMGFLVVPVVGRIGADSGEPAEPDYALLLEIKSALEAFRPNVQTVH